MESNDIQTAVRKKKPRQIIIKILFLLSGLTFIAAGSAYAVIVSTLAQERFYAILAPAAGAVIFLLLFTFIFWKNKRLTVTAAFILFLILVSFVIGLRVLYQAYHNSPVDVFLRDIDIMERIPFTGTTAHHPRRAASVEIIKGFPVFDGSAALYPVYCAFGRALNPDFTNEEAVIESSLIKCSNNPRAFENLLSGEADIVFTESLSQSQLEEAAEKGIKLNIIAAGREAFVFFVNKENPVDNITTQQARGIYSGRITNWREMGGKNERITAFQRRKNSGGQNALEHFMRNDTIMKVPQEEIVSGIGGAVKKVADYGRHKNALGFSFRFFVSDIMEEKNIKILHIDGIYPSEKSIRNGSYPLTLYFYAVTAGSKNPNIDNIINWILSGEGQKTVEESGYVPLD